MILPIPDAPPVISTFADLICIVLKVLRVLRVLIQKMYQNRGKGSRLFSNIRSAERFFFFALVIVSNKNTLRYTSLQKYGDFVAV
jgi:hypothetical protein